MKTPHDDSLMHMIATRFNCTPAQVAALYRKNAAELLQMAQKAKRTGKKVNGFTEQYLREKAAEFSTRGAAKAVDGVKTVTLKEARAGKYMARGLVQFYGPKGQPTRTLMLQETTPLAMLFRFDDDSCVVETENLDRF